MALAMMVVCHVTIHLYTYTSVNNLLSVRSLCLRIHLSKVIYKLPQTGRQIVNTIHKVSQWDVTCNNEEQSLHTVINHTD